MTKGSISLQTLAAQIAECPTNMLLPRAFFVSWHGVMTLAYEGFSKSILDMKASLEARFPSLPAENEGSKWPKTTLGALNQGRVLTLAELASIRDLCDRHNALFTAEPSEHLKIDALTYVQYDCRSLERVSTTKPMPLKQKTPPAYEPPDIHKNAVDSVLKQFAKENLANYIEKVQQDGHRENHYRSYHPGSSLIYQLPPNTELIDRITSFKKDLDSLFQDTYAWFEPQSLHVTIRSLEGG
jgi:hypothetical protein